MKTLIVALIGLVFAILMSPFMLFIAANTILTSMLEGGIKGFKSLFE